jgi:DNA mismatch repair protein MutS
MQQYREIKARHQNAILMFRMGDFYEMFFDDAEIASRELGLTLTTRNNGAAAEVPLAGVPVKAVSGYVRRLVERGFRVAICEQVEDPRLAKGIVRREVVETVTPGAALEEELLETTRNNFLVAVEPGPGAVGIAALDLSTGELALEVVAPADLPAALERYAPREIVVPSNAGVAADSSRVLRTEREPWEFDAGWTAEELMRRFDIATLEGLGLEAPDRPALAAAAALLRYAAELKPGGLPQLARPRVIRSGDLMPLDEMTRRNLELVELLRPDATGLTLLAVLDRTVTPMGARLLRRWLLAPLRVPAAIRERLDAVDVLFQDSRGRARLREAADGVRDVERLVGRAVTGRASPRDLGALRDSLGRLPDVRGALDGLARRETSVALERLAGELDLLTDLMDQLRQSLAERPPASAGDGDAIRADADPELDQLRELRDGGKRIITGIQARERERTGIASLKVGYNKVFGYYIEVTRAHRASIPADYERRQTLSGAERYVTPELKDLEARVLGAEDRIAERERELLAGICRAIAERLERLQRTARAVAELDVYASLAEVAAREGYARPSVTEEFRLEFLRSRHPVVERMLPRGSFIPNDVLLDEHQRVILLTGPNMAGTSTVLRQVGLLVVMAQMGSFVPAERARVGVVDRVFTRVGASDNLGRGQSTFMVEMAETSAILHSATAHSLVLLDEIGRGTSTFDGVAIAWAVTEHLHDRIGCKTVFATHYHELTQLTEELAHARNFNVAVRESGEEVVFLHRLEPGGADRSYGIHVARLAGLPPDVVSRARQILGLLESGHHVAGAAPPPLPDARQLALFDAAHPVLEDLRAIDPDSLTPLEALNRLAALRRRAQELG